MSMLSVNQPMSNAPHTSALENAAKVLGIVTSLGSLGAQGYNSLVTAPQQAQAAQTSANAMKAIAQNPNAYSPQVLSTVMGANNPMNPQAKYGLGVYTQQP